MKNVSRIALTGASGHLGTSMLSLLLENDYQVNALFHSSHSPISHTNLTWIKGDINDEETIRTLISGCSTVIHTAGLISIGNFSKKEILDTNVKGTETVIKQCIEHNATLFHISSTHAVRETKGLNKFDENRPYKTVRDFDYPYSKAITERLILQAQRRKGLKAVIFRPSSIVGPPDYKASLMGKTIWGLAQNKFPFIPDGGYDIVDVRDVSQSVLQAIRMNLTSGIYLLSGHFVTTKQLQELANGSQKPTIPISMLLPFTPIIQIFSKMLKMGLPITEESLLTLKNAPANMDCSKAKRELHHNPRPIEQTIHDVVHWYETHA